MSSDEKFINLKKLQNRYWVTKPLLDLELLLNNISKKITFIEEREFGVDEDVYIITTKAKIIINGLSLKIYSFIKEAIILIDQKKYIAVISLLRLCVEHLVMLKYFFDTLKKYVENKNIKSLKILLFSFTMGERIYYVDAEDKTTGKREFTTRAEHVLTALRYFDKKYINEQFGIQNIYDVLSNHTHVSPTSSVRMLYRQKRWDVNEPIQNFRRVKLSTISNSHEKTSLVGLELILPILDRIENDN